MKKLLFFTSIIAVCIIHTAIAQEYKYVPMPTKNAIWSVLHIDYQASPIYDTINEKFVLFDEDTVIFGHNYQKLYRSFDSIPTKEKSKPYGFIREDDKIVYYYNSSYPTMIFDKDILYDFNIVVGDTMFMEEMPFMQVYKIDTIELYGIKRKKFYFKSDGADYGMRWIEGIGSVNGLLIPGTYPVSHKNILLCLYHNNELLYYNNLMGECYPDFPNPNDTTGIFEKAAHKVLNIYPNPFTEQTTIEFQLQKPATVTVYISDITGRAVKQIINRKKLKGGKHFYKWQPQSSTLSGLYTVFLFIDNTPYTAKIIKQ